MNGSHRQGHGFAHRRGHRQKDGHEENPLLSPQEDNQDLPKEDQEGEEAVFQAGPRPKGEGAR